ncbi:MAG: marine proteobacterial sortase target protein [Methyloceanibacter sp.]
MTMRRQALLSREPLVTLSFFSLILALFFTLPSMLARAEDMPEGSDRTAYVQPGDMNTGALLLQSGEDGGFVEAPRLNTDAAITVNGTIARVVVTQRFENPSDRWLEGIYVFPLPEQSAVDALHMEIGSRMIEGEIKGRQEAQQLYEAAKDNGQKASLVEEERPNIFTNSVANIGPHESIVIRIEYQETVKQDGGVYSLRFPLVVAPRYNPAPSNVDIVDYGGKYAPNDPVPDRDRITPPVLDPAKAPKINPVSIEVKLNAGFVLGDVTSSFHKISLNRSGDETATLSLADGTVPADKDFELVWRPKAAAVPQTALFHELVNGQDYLLAMVTPPSLDQAPKQLPRELIFVIDNSGSMAGTSINQAKQSLLLALDRLRPGDKFNVIRFDDTMDVLFKSAVDVTPENSATAKNFVSRLDAEGGTEMLPALKAALGDANPSDTSRLRQVVFLTDGAVGNEAQLFQEIAEHIGRSRLFTVGIGSAPNTYFMRRAAELGRGTFTEIGSEDQVLERMSALFAKLEKPVMVGLKASWPDGTAVETWPDPLPDLYAGEPVVLSAKVSSMSGELHFSGTFDGKPWTAALKISDAIDGAGVAKLWARSKIAALEAKAYTDPNDQGIEKAIETVALEHHLVSSQTSLVAIDKVKSRPDGEGVSSVDMPLNLPDGWVYNKVFGSPTSMPRQYKAMGGGLNQSLAPMPAAPGAQNYAFDGGKAGPATDAMVQTEAAPPHVGVTQAPDTSTIPADAGPATPDVDTSVTPSVSADGDAEVQAPQSYPLLPLTVVPKPDASPMASLKTPNDITERLVVLALLLTILSAVTLVMWRYHRRDYASPRRTGRRF